MTGVVRLVVLLVLLFAVMGSLSQHVKLDEIAQKLDGKLAAMAQKLDGKLAEMAQKLDGKLAEIAQKLDGKLAEIAQKLDLQVQVVSNLDYTGQLRLTEIAVIFNQTRAEIQTRYDKRETLLMWILGALSIMIGLVLIAQFRSMDPIPLFIPNKKAE